jgi:hypothetical protein
MRLIPRRGPRQPNLPKRRPATLTRRGTFRPTLHALEARDVPSTLVVTNISDTGVSGDGSLRGEIATAQSGDTITFDSGLAGQTITLDPAKGALHLSTNLTITGLGANQTTISGGHATGVFTIDSGTTDTLAQLTITDGRTSGGITADGGGIFNAGTLTVDHCTLSGNAAENNGIYNGGTLTVVNSTVSGNSVFGNPYVSGFDVWGGGIYNAGTLTVDQSTLSGNSAISEGGGIFNVGTLTVDQSTLSGNFTVDTGSGIGGGITNLGGKVTVGYTTISGNSAGAWGGGIFSYSGTVTVDHSLLFGNSERQGGGGGGGIFNGGTMTVEYSTLAGNTARTVSNYNIGDGGGILNGGTLTVDHSTLSGNSAGDVGGGISNGGTLTVNHSTLAGNSAVTNGGGIWNVGTVTIDQSTLAGNSAGHDGGGIWNSGGDVGYNGGTVTVDRTTLAGNSAGHEGGGIWNSGGGTGSFKGIGTVTVEFSNIYGGSAGVAGGGIFNDGGIAGYNNGATVTVDHSTVSGNSAPGVGGGVSNSGRLTVQNESAVYGNQAPSGADLENSTVGGLSPALSISHSAVVTLDDQNPGATTVTVAATDTATGLTPSVASSGQITFTAQVLAAQAGAGTPTGTATLYDGNNNVLGSMPFTNGQAVFNAPSILSSAPGIFAVYANDGNSSFTASTSGLLIQAVDALSPDNLQNMVTSLAHSPATAVALDVTPSSEQDALNAVNGLTGLTGPVTVVLNLAPGTYTNATAHPPAGVTLIINGVVTNTINQPSTTLTSSANPALFGQSVTLTATVATLTPNTGTPTGTVSFLDQTSGTTLATAPLSGGVATWTSSSLIPGSHTIVAVYSGDVHYITSSATLVQTVRYQFGGFLAPLHPNMTYAAGKTIPIKFQVTGYNGIYVSSLSAVTSLKVLNASGTDVLAGAGKTGLRYDPTANQFVFNWQTKGLSDGTYTIVLALNDGTTQSLALTLSSKGAFQLAGGATSGYESSAANQVLYGTLSVAVEDDTGAGITPSELARISDAMSYLNAALGSFGVDLTWAAPGTAADVTIHFAGSTPEGSAADSVLGFTTAANDVYFAEGWDFYTGADAAQVGAGQYDFQTLAEHELAHTVGLGESSDPGSVMYEYLAPGSVRRTFTDGNLTLINSDADRYMKAAAPAGASALAVEGQRVSLDAFPVLVAQKSIVPSVATAGGADERDAGRRTGGGDVGLVATDWLTSAAIKKSKSTLYTDWLTDS